MTLLAGVSCARAIRRVTGLDARLKWPNDIFIQGKKAAGILAEMEGETACLRFVILGVGINVNWDPARMPADLRETATSLRAEAGKEFDRAALAREALAELEKDYGLFREAGFLGRDAGGLEPSGAGDRETGDADFSGPKDLRRNQGARLGRRSPVHRPGRKHPAVYGRGCEFAVLTPELQRIIPQRTQRAQRRKK